MEYIERTSASEERERVLRDALKLAQPILANELQVLCQSYCPPCKPGELFDYSQLEGDELKDITETEAALDAVDAALALAPEQPAAPCANCAKLQWQPITPENLPKVGDEVYGRWNSEEFVRMVLTPLPAKRYIYGCFNNMGCTHFRTINPPAPCEPAQKEQPK